MSCLTEDCIGIGNCARVRVDDQTEWGCTWANGIVVRRWTWKGHSNRVISYGVIILSIKSYPECALGQGRVGIKT